MPPMLKLVPSGCASADTEPSGFRMIEPERPDPPAASTTFTVMLAAGLDETAKTGRAAPEFASTVTSIAVTTAGNGGVRVGWLVPPTNDAQPPGGCELAIVMWKVRCSFVKFCSVTTKARWRFDERGFTFW